jgi:hypothetical protein
MWPWYHRQLCPSFVSNGLLLWIAFIAVSCAVPSRYRIDVMDGYFIVNACVFSMCACMHKCRRSIVIIVLCEALQDTIALLAVCIRVHVPCSIIVRHMGPHNRCRATAANLRGPAPHLARTLFRSQVCMVVIWYLKM